jgi:single-stranded-DNA-specific exonuclease
VLEQALGPREAAPELPRLVCFAALSTVADVVPLVGENRVIVAHGLASARAGAVLGIRALCERAGRAMDRLTAHDLAFTIIPRLNAAGRMGDAREALDLLLAAEAPAAEELAEHLEATNKARRAATDEVLTAIEEEAFEAASEGVIVLAGDYSIGLAGIVASRMVDRHGVPCAVIEQTGHTSRGSIRGPEGIDLVAALEACSRLLERFGGHPRAAGFTLPTPNINRFREAFQAAVKRQLTRPLEPRLLADAPIRLSSVGWRLAELVARFEPTGAGNPNPTFVSRSVTVRTVEQADSHLRLSLGQGAAVRRAVAFRAEFEPPEPGAEVDALYEVERNYWNDEARIDVILRGVRPVEH